MFVLFDLENCGYWGCLQEYLNVKFKETGHSNMYFPQVRPLHCLILPFKVDNAPNAIHYNVVDSLALRNFKLSFALHCPVLAENLVQLAFLCF